MKLFLILIAFTVGCTSSRFIHQDAAQTEAILEKLRPGDPVTITLVDGTTLQGNFFSCKEGLLTLKIGDFFRDTELQKIHLIEYKSESKHMKAMIIVLMALTGGYIIYTFITNH